MKRYFLWIGLLCGMLLLAGCVSIPFLKPQPSPTPGPLDLVKAHETAFNSGDIEAVMSLFDLNDLRVFDPNMGVTIRGVTGVRNWVEFLIGEKIFNQFSDCKLENELVTCTGSWTNQCLNDMRISPIKYSSVVFRIKDNHILAIDLTQTLTQEYQDKGGRFGAWMQKTYPKEYSSIMGPLETALTRENGETFIKLCSEFAKTLP